MIQNVNHMTQLIILDASDYNCRIDQNGIKDLNLEILNARGNGRINNVNHMTK